MSAAVNRTHDIYSSRPLLPLVGDLHPLRREFERLLAMSNMIALSFALLTYAIIYFWPREVATPLPIEITIDPGIFPSPPPIAPTGGVPAMPAVQPDIEKANFEPVDTKDLPNDSAQTEPQAGSGDPDGTPSDGGLGPVTLDPIATPQDPPANSPEHSWWDEAPVLLSIDPPVYPDMVRDAGIDGTVNVRVLIDVNGKVKDARLVGGNDMLREAAIKSARTAIFKPALQGVHPVEVWVVIPISFKLHENH